MTNGLDPVPTPTIRERLTQVGFAALTELPGGSTCVEIFRQAVGTSFERRQTRWLEMIYELVLELQGQGVDVEELARRSEFATALHDATRVALGEHLEQKLSMLISILRNAAHRPGDRAADIVTLRYLRWVDEFEPEHVLLLRRADIKTAVNGKAASGQPDDQAVVDQSNEIEATQRALMVEELDARGLIKGRRVRSASETIEEMSAASATGRRPRGGHEEARAMSNMSNATLTQRGREFLSWIGHMS